MTDSNVESQVSCLLAANRKEDGRPAIGSAKTWVVGSQTTSRDDAYVMQEERKMSRYMQYAMAATQEALDDAGWHPQDEKEKEMTVC